jgi:hypothetical protein
MPVPPEAQRAFPSVRDILAQKLVRLQMALQPPLSGPSETGRG